MSTFVERHGFVKYPVPGYNLTGLACEVVGCAEKRHQQRLAYLWQALDDLVYFEHLSYADQRTQWPLGREGQWDRLVSQVASSTSELNAPYKRLILDHCHQHLWIRGICCQSCNHAIGLIDAGKPAPPLNRLPAYYGLNLVVPEWEKFRLNCPECRGESAPPRQYVAPEYLRPRKS
jgi:hypothetical protein